MKGVLAPGLDISMFFGFVSRSLDVSSFASKFKRLGPSNPGFRIEGIPKTPTFHINHLLWISRSIFIACWRRWEQCFLFLLL